MISDQNTLVSESSDTPTINVAREAPRKLGDRHKEQAGRGIGFTRH